MKSSEQRAADEACAEEQSGKPGVWARVDEVHNYSGRSLSINSRQGAQLTVLALAEHGTCTPVRTSVEIPAPMGPLHGVCAWTTKDRCCGQLLLLPTKNQADMLRGWGRLMGLLREGEVADVLRELKPADAWTRATEQMEKGDLVVRDGDGVKPSVCDEQPTFQAASSKADHIYVGGNQLTPQTVGNLSKRLDASRCPHPWHAAGTGRAPRCPGCREDEPISTPRKPEPRPGQVWMRTQSKRTFYVERHIMMRNKTDTEDAGEGFRVKRRGGCSFMGVHRLDFKTPMWSFVEGPLAQETPEEAVIRVCDEEIADVPDGALHDRWLRTIMHLGDRVRGLIGPDDGADCVPRLCRQLRQGIDDWREMVTVYVRYPGDDRGH